MANMKNFGVKHSMLMLTICAACISQNASANRPAMSDRAPAPEAQELAQPAPLPAAEESAVDQAMSQQQGDVLTMPATELQAGETLPVRLLDFPRRGMSMNKVQNELGRPVDISPTVGQPPITSWSYDDRTVFFEGDIVIHVVAIN